MAADPHGIRAFEHASWQRVAADYGGTFASATRGFVAPLLDAAEVGGQTRVLDVCCGPGLVAGAAAARGASAAGVDFSSAMLAIARSAQPHVEFSQGDAEALPYPDASFDVVLSQFGHMFAPRPQVVLSEMLRVLKVGGRLAYSTWPPEHFPGRMFTFLADHAPPSPGAEPPAPPALWGDPNVVRQRLGAAVSGITFARATLTAPALSLTHFRVAQEKTIGPLGKIVASLENEPAKLSSFRADFEAMASEAYADNAMRFPFLMTRATKL